jgi:hypothetical protein
MFPATKLKLLQRIHVPTTKKSGKNKSSSKKNYLKTSCSRTKK